MWKDALPTVKQWQYMTAKLLPKRKILFPVPHHRLQDTFSVAVICLISPAVMGKVS